LINSLIKAGSIPNNQIDTAQVIKEFSEIAREMKLED